MKVAKADTDDLQSTHDFLMNCEQVLETPKFSFNSAEDDWEKWDDDDDDKILITKLKTFICKNEDIESDKLDNRILMYEFLKRKFGTVSCKWRRVTMAADILIENVCDPSESHLAFYPGMEQFHVMPEQ